MGVCILSILAFVARGPGRGFIPFLFRRSSLVLALIPAVHAGPLLPEQEHATFHLADDSLIVELVASEPDILSPVAMTWDARGRMFVAEMIDYPLGPGSGRVRMLEDANHDGCYEKAVVFVDNLPFPNGVLPWKDGLLVTAAPDILFLKDSDGDGRADERRVILTGFAEGNQQLRVNGLLWGLDGWVYGANGRSDGEIRRPGETRSLSLRGHDFRFQPDTGEYEVIAGRSQFGLARDDWGNRFLSWNTIAIRHEVIPERFLLRNPNIPATEAVHDLAPAGDKGEVFPLTATPRTFNRESTSHFNALAGLTIYRGDALPARYKGNAFMGETLRNLVHRRVLQPEGPSFVARRGEAGTDFLASTDPWFHPVNFATGPDGALYIVDFYREWVEHPGYVPEKFRGQFAWRTGAEHGRIWRIRPRVWKRPRFQAPSAKSLIAYLEHPNGWWRDTAARLLMERNDASGIGPLKRLARARNRPEAAVHALYALSTLNGLNDEMRASALKHPHPRVRETALRLGAHLTRGLVEDSDPAVRLWAVLTLRQADAGELGSIALRSDLDRITSTAIRSRASENPWLLLKTVQSSPSPGPVLLELVHALASDVGRGKSDRDQAGLMRAVDQAALQGPGEIHLALFSGFKQGQGHSTLDNPEKLISFARAIALRPEASLMAKTHALQTLAGLAASETSPSVLSFLDPAQEPQLQAAAAKAVVETGDLPLFEKALSAWGQYQIKTRRQLLNGALRSTGAASLLAAAMEHGTLSSAELDASTRQNLLRLPSDELKARLEKVLGPPVSEDRAEVIKRFAAALPRTGDRARGQSIFERACAQCHPINGNRGGSGAVGPALSGIASRTRESLLVDILDPSRQVNPEFVSYTVVTREGETLTGLLVSENQGSVTLRRPNVPDESIPRSRVRRVQAGQASLMPDGLETGLTPENLADLIEFLSNPL